jgi:LMBR1 domain-containing protein 1
VGGSRVQPSQKGVDSSDLPPAILTTSPDNHLQLCCQTNMALIETSLIWVAYAVCLGIIFLVSAVFVFVYQKPSERAYSVTIVCWLTVLALLATVLLLPVDIALVSSTTSRSLGRKKDWATPDKVDETLYILKIVYYTLYSLDAVLCLIVVPFTYFWYEEYDEVATMERQQSVAGRLWGALKYTFAFIFLAVILFLVGFFVPVVKKTRNEHKDLDYFKDILLENRKFLTGCNNALHIVLIMPQMANGLSPLPLVS